MSNYDAILCRTNAGVIAQAIEQHASGKTVKVTMSGGFGELRKWSEAATMLLNGESPWKFPALQAFNNWPDVQDHSKTDEGAELRPMVRLIDNYGVEAITGMMTNCIDGADRKKRNLPADVTIITAHKSKGLEWDRVLLHSDFTPAKTDPEPPSETELRLFYVAVTRAKLHLDASALAWVFQA
jgi:hypothetical protein